MMAESFLASWYAGLWVRVVLEQVFVGALVPSFDVRDFRIVVGVWYMVGWWWRGCSSTSIC